MLAAPYLCGCNYSIRGFVVQAPAGKFDFAAAVEGAAPQKVTYGKNSPASLTEDASDWPTHRAGNTRNSASSVAVPATVKQLWVYEPTTPHIPTPSVAAGGLAFISGDDGRVTALDSAGKVKWTFATSGKVFAAPTFADGRVFVGSSDGHVYALNGTTGRLRWRYRVAPAERSIMIYGHLSSAWAVNTGVLVHDGVAYAGAGLIDRDGTIVCALDAATGGLKWQNVESAWLDKANRKGVSAHGYMTIAGGRLWMPAGNAVGLASYDLKTGVCVPLGLQTYSVYKPVTRGRESGFFMDKYLITGGEMVLSHQYQRKGRTFQERYDRVLAPCGQGHHGRSATCADRLADRGNN